MNMQKLIVFNHVSLDGYFVDAEGDMSFAYNDRQDPEWDAFVAGNASGKGTLIFGRITYEMMASYWPTPAAAASMPLVAQGMNNSQKVVFSRTLDKVSWANTRLVKDDLIGEIRRTKDEPGPGMVILGSGSIVSQLAQAGLIDEYQLVVDPIAVGQGRTLFDGMKKRLPLTLVWTRTFGNGNVVLCYRPRA
jgi:dihydrofolate reductase